MDEQIGKRLREMRQNAKLSQARVAAVVGSRQSAVARFESGEAHVPSAVMVRYADYFDVSLDYIFGRTDNPQGKLYENKPRIEKAYVGKCKKPLAHSNANGFNMYQYKIGMIPSMAKVPSI